jgi:hypothetical protein
MGVDSRGIELATDAVLKAVPRGQDFCTWRPPAASSRQKKSREFVNLPPGVVV